MRNEKMEVLVLRIERYPFEVEFWVTGLLPDQSPTTAHTVNNLLAPLDNISRCVFHSDKGAPLQFESPSRLWKIT